MSSAKNPFGIFPTTKMSEIEVKIFDNMRKQTEYYAKLLNLHTELTELKKELLFQK